VKKNAEKFMDQLFFVLDKERTEVRWQTEWFGDMTMSDVLKLMGKWTLAQFMAHDTFRKRYEEGLTLGMHEIMYPILQSYDSVAIHSDIELGATEQKFNILCGRDMQRYHGQQQQVAILSPILMGTDGINKMSKSLGNYIAIYDSPQDKYGKVMSIPDNLIINYFNYATRVKPDEVAAIEKELSDNSTNPKIIKQRLAREVVKLYHGEATAMEAENQFNLIFSQKKIPDDMPQYVLNAPAKLTEILTLAGLCESNSEAKRLIKQKAVSIDNTKISDFDYILDNSAVIKAGKRRFLKVILQNEDI
jgi:tyrosyl-tRNA synthetase